MKILFLLGASLIYQSNCSAQEFDFSKFKFEGSQVIKSKLITISKTNPLWQQIKLKPIKNVPVKLVDNNNSVNPNQKMITPTNKVLTAKAYVDSLNYYERELNKEL